MVFNFFRSAPFLDAALGVFERSGSVWRGTMRLDGESVPLVLPGTRTAPDPGALLAAREVPGRLAVWRATIARELFEHYTPYAEAVSEGGASWDPDLPRIDGPGGVWAHATLAFVRVASLDGERVVELGYRVAWDEEHLLGARFGGTGFVELSGSVPGP